MWFAARQRMAGGFRIRQPNQSLARHWLPRPPGLLAPSPAEPLSGGLATSYATCPAGIPARKPRAAPRWRNPTVAVPDVFAMLHGNPGATMKPIVGCNPAPGAPRQTLL